MSAGFQRSDAGILAVRVAAAAQAASWTGVLARSEDGEKRVADTLADTLREVAGCEVHRLHVGGDGLDLVRTARATTDTPLVVSGLDTLTPDDWRRLDLARSALRRNASVVLVASRQAFESLARHAPNLLSWMHAVYEWDDDTGQLTDDERSERVAALERWSGLSSAEVVARAERDELPADPEYREWLVLLDRGDLLAR